jgi:hypothetical protein
MLETHYTPSPSSLPKDEPHKASWELGWIHFFLIFQFALQLLLLLPQVAVLRGPMRFAAFAISLFLLVWIPGKGINHPSKPACMAAIYILLLQLFLNPNLNSVLGGIAQCTLYIAIFGPVFWVSRLKISLTSFKSLIYILWGFHTLSAFVGVLQVYYPGQFQPALSTTVQNQQWGGDNLRIVLANGLEMYRPMGLTDAPGGAARAGFFAIIFGVGFALQSKNIYVRFAGLASSTVGLFCIYLSQVRSTLIIVIFSLLLLGLALLKQGRLKQLSLLTSGASTLFVTVFSWAIAVGGNQTLNRFLTLTQDDPASLYQKNRGGFLQHAIQDLLPQYPFGAGLGRWGISNTFFGENYDPSTQPIWVEIQWTGWLLDGGVPLIIAYALAMFFVIKTAWDASGDKQLPGLNFWAAVILTYDLSIFVSMFNAALLIGQAGLEFWLLNMVLVVAIYQERKAQALNTNTPDLLVSRS